MTLVPLILYPGIYTEHTDRDTRNRIKSCNHVRWHENYPEKIGGRIKQTGSAYLGVCRKLHPFRSLNRHSYLALGTHLKAYVWDEGSMVDITPYRQSGTLTDPFSTTATSAVVTVADTAHGLSVGDYVTFDNATASPLDSIVLDGDYTVTSVIDANTYTVTHTVVATNSEAAFGGSVDFDYEIPVGFADSTFGGGWGAGTWGTGTWGTPRTSSDLQTPARTWAIQSWGEDLILNPRGGSIYVFDTSVGVTTANRATLISQAPETAQFILVSPEDRFLIAYGAHDGSDSDPMLVRWCSQEDYTTWLASSINTAGTKRLDCGTRIVTAVLANRQILILTDTSAVLQSPIGYPDVYGFTTLASGCGSVSPNAAAEKNGIVEWMGEWDFFRYDGTVQALPRDVWEYVFKDINRAQLDKVYSGVNSRFNEFWWFYPSADSNENDRYVIHNYKDNVFYVGEWNITAWSDEGVIDSIVSAADGYLYDQESGYDDDTLPLVATLETYDAEIGEGEDFTFVTRLIPDFKSLTGTVDVTIKKRRFPSTAQSIKTTTIMASTKQIKRRIRGRQVCLEVASYGLGDYWRMGPWRADIVKHGGK